jgi:membrane protease YdiL (CAAX protease family)
MLFVGLFEETAFRALINDSIVYQFRSFKHVFLLSAILSSLIFGYVHVMFVPVNSPIIAGQVVGKTISTALFGLASLSSTGRRAIYGRVDFFTECLTF